MEPASGRAALLVLAAASGGGRFLLPTSHIEAII
jgi:hypothetical protein